MSCLVTIQPHILVHLPNLAAICETPTITQYDPTLTLTASINLIPLFHLHIYITFKALWSSFSSISTLRFLYSLM